MSEELKPCPFCGSQGLVAKGIHSSGWWGYCKGCGAEAEGALTKDAAIASWNRRATPTKSPVCAAIRAWPPDAKFNMGDRVRKHSGSWWEGRVVGFYSTAQTPIGYCVQLDTVEHGPVQIYPETALEITT